MALFFVFKRQAVWQQRGRQVIVVAAHLVPIIFIGICVSKQRSTMQLILSIVGAVAMSGRPMGDLRPATDATKEQRTTAVVTSRDHWRVGALLVVLVLVIAAVVVLWFRSNIPGLFIVFCDEASHRSFENSM